jgi:DNA-binding XRE family transcriptional regulator
VGGSKSAPAGRVRGQGPASNRRSTRPEGCSTDGKNERKQQAEGPGAVKELETFRAHFRLGRQIAEVRRARHLTQRQVAEIARIDQADVSNIERGAANPTFTTLNAVVSAVGMEIDLARKRRVR